MLKIDGKKIVHRDNGADGVLFTNMYNFRPWTYKPDAERDLVASVLIDSLTYEDSETITHSPAEQKLLMLVWMLSLSFETLQPTKPLAVAMGPEGSGKSNFFRRVGQMLFGSDFEVMDVQRDKETQYWNAVTNWPFVCIDQMDKYVPWLEDALASTSTGVVYTTKELYTTNKQAAFTPRCFLSLTSRNPRFRRQDVASRVLAFRVKRLPEKRREQAVLDEVVKKRDDLMSDLAHMLNRVLANPFREATDRVDPSLRLADFVGVAAWIGESFGPKVGQDVIVALNKLKSAQFTFVTEEDDLVLALEHWIVQENHVPGQMLAVANSGRRTQTTDLAVELKALYEQLGMTWRINGPTSLGKKLETLEEGLSARWNISHARTNRGAWWCFGIEQSLGNLREKE